MRIRFEKLSGERHVLEIVRSDGGRERIECESRSYLRHDLLHYAVEAEARLEEGFWGRLARGATFEQLNDRTGSTMTDSDPMLAIERIVGALTSAAKGFEAERVFEGFREYATAIGVSVPHWLSSEFVAAVKERMRKLEGRWKATPYHGAMELAWPDTESVVPDG
jgi:hypothetical protein